MSVKHEDGGPAFPLQSIGPDFASGYCGMSLRDWFAGQALSGIVSLGGDGFSLSEQDSARWAYKYADAMMSERDGGGA